jgi:hypothetical protein
MYKHPDRLLVILDGEFLFGLVSDRGDYFLRFSTERAEERMPGCDSW